MFGARIVLFHHLKMGFQSKRRRHLDKVRPGGKKQCAGQQQDNEEQQHGGTRSAPRGLYSNMHGYIDR